MLQLNEIMQKIDEILILLKKDETSIENSKFVKHEIFECSPKARKFCGHTITAPLLIKTSRLQIPLDLLGVGQSITFPKDKNLSTIYSSISRYNKKNNTSIATTIHKEQNVIEIFRIS